MPVYNGMLYLNESIRSILTQSFSNFEFIIINDGSTDGSEEVLNHFAKVDNRIRLVHQDNKGVTHALNHALALAKGKLIARMDADDISLPERLERQFEVMERNTAVGVCHGLVNQIYANGRFIPLRKKTGYLHSHLQTQWTLLWKNCIFHPTVMFRNEIIHNWNLCYDEAATGVEDYKLWCQLSEKTKFYSIKEPLLLYRRHNKGITGNFGKLHMRNKGHIISDNMKSLGINGLSDEHLKELVLISGHAYIPKHEISWKFNADFFLNLLEQVIHKFTVKNNLKTEEKREIIQAAIRQLLRWTTQTWPKRKSMAIQFLKRSLTYALNSR